MPDAPTLDRPAPQNIEAEKTVLGAILIEPACLAKVMGMGLRPDHFARDAHRRTYAAIVDLAGRSVDADLVTLKDELARRSELESVGGAGYLSSLVDGVPDVVNVERWAGIVRERSVLRRLQAAGRQIFDEASSGSRTGQEVLESAEAGIFGIAEDQVEAGFTHIAEIADRNIKSMQDQERQHGALTGLETGFEKLDAMTSGFQRSDLIIVAARPAMGKTSYCLNIASHMAIRKGKVVAVFSLEMSKEQLGLRVLSAECRIPAQYVRGGYLSPEQWQKLILMREHLEGVAIHIDDTAAISVVEMRAKARRLKMEAGRLDCIIVDYLQLMNEKRRFENRNLEIGAISRGLKALAKELKVPVVALSQLSRQPERRTGDHRPQLADLRESGAIEQDADVVIFIYRDEVYNPETELKGIAEIIVAKQRNGPIGNFNLVFQNQFTRFENMDPSAEV